MAGLLSGHDPGVVLSRVTVSITSDRSLLPGVTVWGLPRLCGQQHMAGQAAGLRPSGEPVIGSVQAWSKRSQRVLPR